MESNQWEVPESTTAAASQAGAMAASGVSDAFGHVSRFTERLAQVATAENCIGLVETHNGHKVIPLATVSVQAGFGLGFGGGGGGDAKGQGQGSGGGGGGGGQASSRPIAVVDVSDMGVKVKPVLDWTRIGLALLALIGLRMLSGLGKRNAQQQILSALKRD